MDITIAGTPVVLGLNAEQYGRINLELAAFDGEIGTGQFPVPDQTGSGFVSTGRQLMVEQGAALLSDGFIIDLDWQRGPFKVGSDREYDYSVQDANALLGGFRVSRTRPAETDYARVMAFAAADGPAWDTTWVLNSSTITMPKKKYDGDGGWAELITDVVEFTGKTLFLHDLAAGGRCLHYHVLTTGHTSGLTITDDLSDLDATHYNPALALRQSTAIDLRNDIRGRDPAGRISTATDATSIAAHDVDGLQHQALIDFDATSQTDLNAKTTAYLASAKNDYNTYSCTIGPLDGTALALIRVGDIISVTSGAMGLSGSNQRIAHMSLSVWNGRPELWLARLELGAPVRRRARVRSSQRAPAIPPYTPPIYDFTAGTLLHTYVMTGGVNSGPGDEVVEGTGAGTSSTTSYGTLGFGAGMKGGDEFGGGQGEEVTTRVFAYPIVGGTTHVRINLQVRAFLSDGIHNDPALIPIPWQLYRGGEILISGEVTPPFDSAPYVGPDPAVPSVIDMTFAATGDELGAATFDCTFQIDPTHDPVNGINLNGPAPTTTEANARYPSNPIDFSYNFFLATGEYPSPYPSSDTTHGTLEMWGYPVLTSGSDGTPAAGTPIADDIVGIGNGTAVTYVAAFPYLAGSLHVFVDDLREWAVTETDPATGTFTFDEAPVATESIRAEYIHG